MRGAGEGSIMRRGDGRWMARLELERVDGKRRRKFIYGHSREAVAQRLAQAIVKLTAGEPIPVGRRTIASFMKEYLDTIKPPAVRKQTWRNYELLNRLHIEPALGSTQLTKLEPQAIQTLLNSKTRQGPIGADRTPYSYGAATGAEPRAEVAVHQLQSGDSGRGAAART